MMRLLVVEPTKSVHESPEVLGSVEAVRPESMAATRQALRSLVRRAELSSGVAIRSVVVGVPDPDRSDVERERLSSSSATKPSNRVDSSTPRLESGGALNAVSVPPAEVRLHSNLRQGGASNNALHIAGSVNPATCREFLRLVESAGVDVGLVVSDGYASLLGIEQQFDQPTCDLVVGVLGARRTTCIIVKKGRVVWFDDRMLGAHGTTLDVAAKLSIPVGDAEELIHTLDVEYPPPGRRLVSNIISDRLIARLTFIRDTAREAGADWSCPRKTGPVV
jgi:hypothetical protein